MADAAGMKSLRPPSSNSKVGERAEIGVGERIRLEALLEHGSIPDLEEILLTENDDLASHAGRLSTLR